MSTPIRALLREFRDPVALAFLLAVRAELAHGAGDTDGARLALTEAEALAPNPGLSDRPALRRRGAPETRWMSRAARGDDDDDDGGGNGDDDDGGGCTGTGGSYALLLLPWIQHRGAAPLALRVGPRGGPVRRVAVAVFGLSSGVMSALGTSALAPGCFGLDCGEHPPAPVFTEYEIVESTEPWLVGGRVILTRHEKEAEVYDLTLRADTPNGPVEILYQWY